MAWQAVATLVLLASILSALAVASVKEYRENCTIAKPIANCRQIILSIRLYAPDEDGSYPDARVPGAIDSNAVFRELFKAGTLEDEKIFGCGASPFNPDGDIGTRPDYAHALESGENHWAMTSGLNDKAPGNMPLVYENPAEAAWPPTWNADMKGLPAKGRVWADGGVILGTNDTSVEWLKLASRTGERVRLKPFGPENQELFEMARPASEAAKYTVLDVAFSQPEVDAKLAQHLKTKRIPKAIALGVTAVLLLGWALWLYASRSPRKGAPAPDSAHP